MTPLIVRRVLSLAFVLFSITLLTFIIGYALHKTMGFRVDRDVEVAGIDINEHAETGYEMSDGYGGAFAGSTGAVNAKTKEEVSA